MHDADNTAHHEAAPVPAEPSAAEPVAASEPTATAPAASSEPAASEPVASEPAATSAEHEAAAVVEPTVPEPAPAATVPEPAPAAAVHPSGLGEAQGAHAAVASALAAHAAQTASSAPPAAPPAPPPVDQRRARAQQAWERVVAARQSGESLSGTVTAAVNGGLLVDVGGIRGFLPASQVRVTIGTAIDTLVKTKLPLKVIDVDAGRRRIVVSHRRAVEEERRTKRNELLRSLQVGQVREGIVVRLADFGAFVDLGGVDGLIPMRELAFERVEKTSDVVTVGEKLMVEVLRIDENGKKISLSRKNALPDPWRDHANVLRRGSTVEGKVVAKEPRLQVEIAPGIIGTVRESDANPADYAIGEAIEVEVRSVDRATRRINLTTMHGAAAEASVTAQTSSGFAPLGEELRQRQRR